MAGSFLQYLMQQAAQQQPPPEAAPTPTAGSANQPGRPTDRGFGGSAGGSVNPMIAAAAGSTGGSGVNPMLQPLPMMPPVGSSTMSPPRMQRSRGGVLTPYEILLRILGSQ